jgi:hypothetical protein
MCTGLRESQRLGGWPIGHLVGSVAVEIPLVARDRSERLRRAARVDGHGLARQPRLVVDRELR